MNRRVVCGSLLLLFLMILVIISSPVPASMRNHAPTVSGGDPGTIAVIDEDPALAQFTVPKFTPVKFDYEPTRIALWDSVARDNVIPPDSPFVACDDDDVCTFDQCINSSCSNAAAGYADTVDTQSNCGPDGLIDDADIFAVLDGFRGEAYLPDGCKLHNVDIAAPGPQCQSDGIIDIFDIFGVLDAFQGVSSCCGGGLAAARDRAEGDARVAVHASGVEPFCDIVTIPVYVQGLTVSTALGDTTITFLTDSDGDTVFELQETQPVTVVSIDISPQSGSLGTEVSVTLNPAIAPIAFDSSSTAQWDGIFTPVSGPASAPFSILYDATQVHESSAASAIIVAGDGSTVNGPNSSTLSFPGTFDGVLTLSLGLTLPQSSDFTPTVAPAVWESITYQDSSLSTGPPVLAGEPTDLEILILSNDPNPMPDEVVLLQSYVFHLAAVLRMAENPTTVGYAPAFIDVDLVTFDNVGVEIGRRQDVRLDRVMGDDVDPANLVYHSDLTKPIVLVDVSLDPASYPNVVVLQAEVSGTANIVPQLP